MAAVAAFSLYARGGRFSTGPLIVTLPSLLCSEEVRAGIWLGMALAGETLTLPAP
jgi:hypothetical protein